MVANPVRLRSTRRFRQGRTILKSKTGKIRAIQRKSSHRICRQNLLIKPGLRAHSGRKLITISTACAVKPGQDGRHFIGECTEGTPPGQGTTMFADGKGIATFPDGTRKNGEFKAGEFIGEESP